MRRFRSFDDFAVFMDGVNASFEFIQPSVVRSQNYELVMHALSLAHSSFHRFDQKFKDFSYVLFGRDICCCVPLMHIPEIEKFKTDFLIFKIDFTPSCIIVKKL